MLQKKIVFLLFFTILLVASIIRLYKIDQIPPGVNRDEASIGYTAYSLLTTGKDEYGRFFPISFESFGDWKLPVYIYLTTGSVKIFGLNELAVRLPSALVGILSVGLTFFLIKELTKNTPLAILTMFLIAIAPWHVHLSRVESESNTAVFLVILGVLLFIKSLRGKSYLIIPSLAVFALTYFTYAGNHIFTTLLLFGILLFYGKSIPRTKYTLVGIVLFIFLSVFIFFHTLFGADQTKISGIGIFSDIGEVHNSIDFPRRDHEELGNNLGRLFHNKATFAPEQIIYNYMNAFSPEFLFIKGGDNKAHNISNFGNMYLVESAFLLAVLWVLIQKKSREQKLMLWWFFIAPIAASITRDAPHTNRMFAIFPMLPFFVAYGIYTFYNFLPRARKLLFVGILSTLFLINITVYLDRYFVHFPIEDGNGWGIGYKRLLEVLEREENKNKKVIFTHPEFSPYIYLLFYTKYDPAKYQLDVKRYKPTEDGFVHVKSYDRFEFRDIDWRKDFKDSSTDALVIPTDPADPTSRMFDSFAYRNINWKKDFLLKNTILVDYLTYSYDSRLTLYYEQIPIIFTSYKHPMFILTEKYEPEK